MFVILYLVLGILFLLVPHFLLSLQLIEAGRSGWVTTYCAFQNHPSWLIGLLVIAGALLAIKSRRGLWLVGLGAGLGIIQGILLKPLSFYLRSEEPLIILGQTISLRAHVGIRPALLILSLVLLAGLEIVLIG